MNKARVLTKVLRCGEIAQDPGRPVGQHPLEKLKILSRDNFLKKLSKYSKFIRKNCIENRANSRGVTGEEIARAFLVPEPTIAQRIVRAKRTLAEERVPFEVPRERAASMTRNARERALLLERAASCAR